MSETGNTTLSRAYELIEQGNPEEARALLDVVLESEPNNADAWWIYSYAAEDPDIARKALEKVLAIDPSYPGASELLGTLKEQFPTSADVLPVLEEEEVETLPSPSADFIDQLPEDIDEVSVLDDVDPDIDDFGKAPPAVPTPSTSFESTNNLEQPQKKGASLFPVFALIAVFAVILILLLLLPSLLSSTSNVPPTSDPNEIVLVPTMTLDPALVVIPTEEATVESTLEVEATDEVVSPVATEEATLELIPTLAIPVLEITEVMEDPSLVTPEVTIEITIADPVATEEVVGAETTEVVIEETPEEFIVELVPTLEIIIPTEDVTVEADATLEVTEVSTVDALAESASTDLSALDDALSTLAIPTGGLATDETALGNSLLVTVCSTQGVEARVVLPRTMRLIGQNASLLGSDLDAVSITLVNCDTNIPHLQVGTGLNNVRGFASGELDETSYLATWRPY